MIGFGILISLLGNQLLGEKSFVGFKIALGFSQLQFGACDFGVARGDLNLEVLIVESKQQTSFAHFITDIDQQLVDAPVDLRTHGHLLSRPNLARDGDRESDIFAFGNGRRGMFRFLVFELVLLPTFPKKNSTPNEASQ